jgi:hypothetical protein
MKNIKISKKFLGIIILLFLILYIINVRKLYFIYFLNYSTCACFNEFTLFCDSSIQTNFLKKQILFKRNNDTINVCDENSSKNYKYVKISNNIWKRYEKKYVSTLGDTIAKNIIIFEEGIKIEFDFYLAERVKIYSIDISNKDEKYTYRNLFNNIPTLPELKMIVSEFKEKSLDNLIRRYMKIGMGNYVLYYTPRVDMKDWEIESKDKINKGFKGELKLVLDTKNCFNGDGQPIELNSFIKQYPDMKFYK